MKMTTDTSKDPFRKYIDFITETTETTHNLVTKEKRESLYYYSSHPLRSSHCPM